MKTQSTIGIITALAVTCAAAAEDWPRWQGPDATGISAETDWSNVGKGDAWRRNVGLGYSCPSIVDGRLYTMGFDESTGQDHIVCLDAKTGDVIWKHSYPAEKWDKYHGGGSNATPVFADDRIFVLNREGRLICLDAGSGDVKWQKEMTAEYGVELPTWGFSGAPLIEDGVMYVNVGRTVAFDLDGNEKWKTKDYGHAYATPRAMKLGGKDVLAVIAGEGLAVLDPTTGNEATFYPWKTQYDVNAATPIPVGEKVFISSGYNHGCALIDLSNGTAAALWENKEMRNHMDTSVVIGEHLYGFDEGTLKCMDLNGNVTWTKRGMGKGALSAAGDRLIIMTAKGELAIANANPEGYDELSKERILEGGVYWTAPVIVDGLIYCRNSSGDLVCRDHRN